VQSFEKLQNRKEYFARVLLAQSAAGTHNKGELIAENV
jgi:ribosomal protein S30